MAFGPESPALARLSQQWWEALAKEPGLDALLAEKARRFDGKQRQESSPGFDFQVAALRDPPTDLWHSYSCWR